MTTTRELREQLAAVTLELHRVWMGEREEARRQIARLAVEFQIPPSTVTMDVEAAFRKAPPEEPALKPPAIDIPLRGDATPKYVEPKYRDASTGDAWSGRGSTPRWLQQALARGASLEDFRVKSRAQDEPEVVDPLREFQDAARRSAVAQRNTAR